MNQLFSNRFWRLLLILSLAAAPGCFLLNRNKQAAPPAATAPQTPPDMSARRDLRATSGAATSGAAADKTAAATGTTKTPKELAEEKKLALMKDTGFDVISPYFSKKTGRKDPFEPVPISEAPLSWIEQKAPESYRLVATARGFRGTFALIELDNKSMIVQKGDMIRGTMKVLAIGLTDVVLDHNGVQKILGMKVRERTPIMEKTRQVGKLPNLNDMWENYLKEKYQGEGGEGAPKDFSAFVTSKEKGFSEEGMFEKR